jgi:uncharacterized protein (DUF169 family)
VAVTFPENAPEGVAKFEGSEPSGCSFWRLAAAGRVFYTVASDHYNCPVGSYTHNIALPEQRASELPDVLNIMTGIGYLRMEEVPGIPVLPKTPAFVLYAPLGETPLPPDVVLIAGQPGHLMLLEEAALRAGVSAKMPLLARPTCMAIPAALAQGVVTSSGCIGNRVYTDLGRDELYAAVPGTALRALLEALSTISCANATLTEYHRQRRSQLASV